MKLRQRLAVTMAAAMVVTAVPVVTMAAVPTASKEVYGTKDSTKLDATSYIKFELGGDIFVGDQFWATLENAEYVGATYSNSTPGNYIFSCGDYTAKIWGSTQTTTVSVIATFTKSKEICFELELANGATVPAGTNMNDVYLPKDTKFTFDLGGYWLGDFDGDMFQDNNDKETGGILLKGGDAYFVVDPNGTGIVGTSGAEQKNAIKVYIGTTQDRKGIASVGTDIPNLFLEGNLADIVITEPYAGAIYAGASGDNANSTFTVNGIPHLSNEYLKVELTLNNPDYEFVQRIGNEASVAYEKGFYGMGTFNGITPIWDVEKYGDKATVYIPIAGLNSYSNTGKIVIKNVPVMANTKTPAEGDLKISVGGELTGISDAVVAHIYNNDTFLEMKDKKVVDLVAGRDKEIEFKHKEYVKDGFLANHTVEYTVDNGYLGEYSESVTGVKVKDATREQKIREFVRVNGYGIPTDKVTVVDVKMDGSKFVGYTVKLLPKVTAAGVTTGLTSSDIDDITYKLHVYSNLDTKDGTEIKITAAGERAIDEEVSVTAVKVKAPVTYTFDAMPVKVGLQNQEYAGKVTITETDKGMIQRGDIILKTDAEGYKFADKGSVKVTSGDLVLDTPRYDKTDGTLIIPVKYASKAASTIEITGFKVTTNRTVPEGTYDLKIDGTSLGTDGKVEAFGDIALSKFFQITTPNTEDIKNSALKAVDVKFVVGSKEYTVDGVAKTMDAAAYLQNGRTMVPLRYVAEAFGIPTENVLFSNGVVTIIAGEKVLQFTLGSNVMSVNGSPITMDAKAELKDGRAYIPMKFVGAALGVTASWDSASQTASFSNKK